MQRQCKGIAKALPTQMLAFAFCLYLYLYLITPPLFLPSTQQQPIVGDAAKKRGSRLKIETLPEDWKAWAEQKRPDLDPHAVFEGFSDYWASAPGQKGIKLDWAATWRNWIRNQAKQAKAEPHQNWWQSESGLLGKGRELGMQPWGGESWAQFKDRLFVACKQKA